MNSKGNKLLVAAIDLGNIYSEYAFAFKHQDLRAITFNPLWNGRDRFPLSFECPTCVLFDENKKYHSFGYEAEANYLNLVEDNMHERWYYFRHFKMSLHKKEIKRDVEIPDVKGLKMPAKKVFGSAIRFLKTHLLNTLENQGTRVAEKDIHWVLPVPAIWSDAAKQFMRETAVSEAEIDSGSLTLALEPEAVSLYCQLLASGKFSGCRLTANKYMILYLKGDTTDITVHENQADGSLRELHEPTGGDWGGNKVDEAFHQILIKIVGAKTFKTFCDSQKEDHADLLRDLEAKKRSILPGSDSKIVVKVPESLSILYEKDSGESIADAIKETPFNDKMSWAMDKFRIEANLFKGLFKECTDGVTWCVRELLQKPEVKDVDTFIMVGGFSESPMMQAAIGDAFMNAKIIIPADAGLVLLKGAVVFGREPMKIASRIAKYTYGIKISLPFDSTLHPQEKRFVVGGKERCKDVFKKYIQKGESIKIGERRSGKHVSLKAHQKEMLLKIYASDAKDPKFITDPGCEYMGRLIVKLPEAQDIFKVNVDMMFGQTELLVEAEEDTSNQKFASYFDFL